MPAERKLPRAGLIGISGYGRIYLQLALEFHRRHELRLVAAVVINPEEETAAVAELRALGCDIFSEYPAMLERYSGSLDLCLIPTGIAWHTRMTLDALAAGANVLVEKPLACALAEVRAIEAAMQQTHRFVAVGFQDFYEPATFWLKQQLIKGGIGTLQSVRFLGQWPRPRSYFTRNNWAGRLVVDGVPVLDSPLSNAFAHFVNLSLFFASPCDDDSADAVLESAELFRAHHIENFDTAVVRMRTAEGVALWFGATHACRDTREPEITLTGTAGSAVWRHENDVRVLVGGHETRHQKVADAPTARRAMMTAVLHRLENPRTTICGPAIAARHTHVIEQIARAGEIRSIPARMIEWNSVDGPAAAVPVIEGLEPALERAYLSGDTLAAAGFRLSPAAQPAAQSRSGR